MRAIQIPPFAILATVGALFIIALPSARLVARVVERKLHTFTIAGALFVGILIAPAIIALINSMFAGRVIPMIPAIAAVAVAYAYGEGAGRLACISFGCCYGKPVQRTHPVLKRIFNSLNFTFAGRTKKVSYEGGLEGIKVIPIQAITAVTYVVIALGGTYMFLKSHFIAATLLAVVGTQLWRSISETMRADYRGRGKGKLSDYQIMAMINIIYVIGLLIVCPLGQVNTPDVLIGLASLWNPAIMIALTSLWVTIFLYTGRSSVTGSLLSFQVHQHRI